MRSVTGSALLVAVLCSAAPVWAQQTAPPSQQPPVIVTRGEASLKRAPDQAFVSIAAEARAASPAEAQRNAADSMKAVQAAISKAGIVKMTESLARVLAPKIRVNAIAPGAILLPDDWDEETAKKFASTTPLKRLGSPDDAVAAMLYLLDAEYVTGETVVVDGGRRIRK